MIERETSVVAKTKVLSIAAIDKTGRMSGYGIGLLYRRIRGRLSCQTAYRARVLINPRKRVLLSFLTWHGVCGNQPSPPRAHLLRSLRLLPLSSLPFPVFPYFPLSLFISLVLCLFVSRSRSPLLFFSFPARELKISNLPTRAERRSNFAWLASSITRSSHAICSNQKLSISVRCSSSEADPSEIAIK